MKVNTELFDEIEVDERDIIHFPKGLLAFEEHSKFILLDLPGNPLFKWLQSAKEPSLAFLITDPFKFFSDYEYELGEKEKEILAVDKPEDIATFIIVTLSGSDITKMTGNLLGPVVINAKNRRAMQIVLQDSKYGTKSPLFKQESMPDSKEGPLKEACK